MHKKSTACSFNGSKVTPVFVAVDFIRLELRFFRINVKFVLKPETCITFLRFTEDCRFITPSNKKHSLEGVLDSHACGIGVVRMRPRIQISTTKAST